MKFDLPDLTKKVIEISENAAAFIHSNYGKVGAEHIEVKGHNSLVSYVDQEAEKLLVNQLSALIPDSGFITEEDTIDDSEKDYVWIIDPLDGTTNFLHSVPHFSTSVALSYQGELVVGVIVNVMAHETFSAYKGGGAFLNGKQIHVNPKTRLSECLIATGFPYDSGYDKKPYLDMLEILMRDARGIRRFGSAALDMVYVACGRFDAFYETSLNPWDVAGGIVICREAGATLSDYQGGEDYLSGTSTIVGNADIHGILVGLTKGIF